MTDYNCHTKRLLSQSGQALVEVVIAVAIATAVITALALASTNSIRNAQFSKNQSQGTKLSQEAVEYLRSYRDRYGFDALRKCTTPASNYLILSQLDIPSNYNTATCYWSVAASGQVLGLYARYVQVTETDADTLSVSVWVDWTDSQGTHTKGSKLETVLTRWRN